MQNFVRRFIQTEENYIFLRCINTKPDPDIKKVVFEHNYECYQK